MITCDWHLRQTAAWLWPEQAEIVALFPTLFVRSAPGTAVVEEEEASDDPAPVVEEKTVDVAPVG